MQNKNHKTHQGLLRFLNLRKQYQKKQKDLRAQFQADLGKAGPEDAVALTRLKLIYRNRGLDI
jgi:hypothetical protein